MNKSGINKMKRYVVYVLVATLILIAGFYLYQRGDQKTKENPQILFLGDSIIGQFRDYTSIPYLVGEALGKSAANCALGGTSLGKSYINMDETNYKNMYTFASLSQMIGYKDFSVANGITMRENATEYFPWVVQMLGSIDYKEVETLVLCYGINDYGLGIPIANEENPKDLYTFQGALRSGIELIREKYPEMKIVFLSPTYTWYVEIGMTCEEVDFGGGMLEDYVQAIKKVSTEYGIKYIDVYDNLYQKDTFDDWKFYTMDGIHPNEETRVLIANQLIEGLKE